MRALVASALAVLPPLLVATSLAAPPPEGKPPRPHEEVARKIVSTGLGTGKGYELLDELCTRVGHRLSGSEGARKAVDWAKATMESIGLENVRLEPVTVPHWERGPVEEAAAIPNGGDPVPLRVCALGGSVATPVDGIEAGVVEVRSFDELRSLGDKAKGKVIFFNRPFDRGQINPMAMYGGAVDQRSNGAIEAAKAGGVAALVRSMTSRRDDVPHTGAMSYAGDVAKVPAAAVSTLGADRLGRLLADDPGLKVRLKLTCRTLPDAESANVVGEIVGSEKPHEIIVIGGHLDSWDKGQGAHDDGAGCVHAIEALRLLKQLGLRPKRTIRAVMFMNEENGQRGARAYADAPRPGETLIAALESDAGGFAPRGFGVGGNDATFEAIARRAYLFEPFGADRFTRGGGGVDVSFLAKTGAILIGLSVEEQRYFDYHHSESDTIDKVNERELELGAAAVAILSYVLSEDRLPSAP